MPDTIYSVASISALKADTSGQIENFIVEARGLLGTRLGLEARSVSFAAELR